MTFAHVGLGMGNDQAYSQLLGLGMGIQNLSPNFWDWEWEYKIKFLTFGIGNGNENLIPKIWKWEIASHFRKGGIATRNFKMPLPH